MPETSGCKPYLEMGRAREYAGPGFRAVCLQKALLERTLVEVDKLLKYQKALVTGASSGIGRAIALLRSAGLCGRGVANRRFGLEGGHAGLRI